MIRQNFRKLFLGLAIIVGLHLSSIAQTTYPSLTHVITFEQLLERKTLRTAEWTNPDGTLEKMRIVELAIPVDNEMKMLTREFLISNYGRDSIWVSPRIIVFHAMGDGDLKTSLNISSFLNDEIPESWGALHRAGKLPNGAHFIIDRNGDVICLSPPVSLDERETSYNRNNHKWIVKRHQDGNPLAIGIENVTPAGNWTDLTKEQLKSNAKLGRWLMWMENGKIDYVMSHHQFNDDTNYALFLKTFHLNHLQPTYRTRGRKDVGDKKLKEILEKINGAGWDGHSFFEMH